MDGLVGVGLGTKEAGANVGIKPILVLGPFAVTKETGSGYESSTHPAIPYLAGHQIASLLPCVPPSPLPPASHRCCRPSAGSTVSQQSDTAIG